MGRSCLYARAYAIIQWILFYDRQVSVCMYVLCVVARSVTRHGTARHEPQTKQKRYCEGKSVRCSSLQGRGASSVVGVTFSSPCIPPLSWTGVAQNSGNCSFTYILYSCYTYLYYIHTYSMNYLYVYRD